jgi:adenosylcobinamide kinase/adenosylcobinamide-phosphate guanylyltransferase
MKVLFIGGIKSGKSQSAEDYIKKKFPTSKPIYLATTEFIDDEMQEKIALHKEMRQEHFVTEEEALHIKNAITKQNGAVLVECLSMWINNMLYHEYSEEEIVNEISHVMAVEQDVVFVINDVSCSVVSANALTRKFVNLNGKVAQIVAKKCDAVFQVIAGISVQIK